MYSFEAKAPVASDVVFVDQKVSDAAGAFEKAMDGGVITADFIG